MPDVLIRDLDEALLERLRERARGNGRSLQDELKIILEAASHAVIMDRASYRIVADRIRQELGQGPQSDSAELLAEDRDR